MKTIKSRDMESKWKHWLPPGDVILPSSVDIDVRVSGRHLLVDIEMKTIKSRDMEIKWKQAEGWLDGCTKYAYMTFVQKIA